MAIIVGKIKPEVAKLWHKYYPNDTPDRLAAYLEPYVDRSSRVLEIGAGSGLGDQNKFWLKGRVKRYVGIDLDRRVLENPNLDEAQVCDAACLPFESDSFDIVFHTKVAERLTDPAAVMRETARVLRQGGMLIFETPNRLYYPMIVAAITPQRVHEKYVARFGSGRRDEDVFPTVYRCNDKRAILAISRDTGFEARICYVSLPPGYLRFRRPSFLLGILYERTIERFVPALRAAIIVFATKL
jgi:SAM-dependent methyltransferase